MTQLPCSTCKAECCGAIPVRRGDLDRIVRAVAKWPEDEMKRMTLQYRAGFTCPFVDTETWRCAIYEVRPTICRLYGLTPGLECPRAPEATTQVVSAIAPKDARRQLARDERKRGDVVGTLGMDIGWDEIWREVKTCSIA